jgi:hypothetical protein
MAGQILASGSTFALSDGSTTAAVNDVQTMTLTATGGTLIIGYAGGLGGNGNELTGSIAASASLTAATIQTAINALPNVGLNKAGLPNVLVTGSAGGPFTFTAQNDLAGRLLPLFTTDASSALTGGTATWAHTTPGARAGGVFTAVAGLTDMVFPNTKKDVKETTNFDSTGLTKEYIGGYINPGDVAVNAMWNGGATQDWRTGLISKFYGGQSFLCRTNVLNKIPQPGVFTSGMAIYFNGFFTDGSPMGAKHDDILQVRGSMQISGLPTFEVPVQ